MPVSNNWSHNLTNGYCAHVETLLITTLQVLTPVVQEASSRVYVTVSSM